MDREQPPFSNGTEYDIWQGSWCNWCVHLHPEFGGPCDDFAIPALTEDRVPDILEEYSLGWRCTKFVQRSAG